MPMARWQAGTASYLSQLLGDARDIRPLRVPSSSTLVRRTRRRTTHCVSLAQASTLIASSAGRNDTKVGSTSLGHGGLASSSIADASRSACPRGHRATAGSGLADASRNAARAATRHVRRFLRAATLRPATLRPAGDDSARRDRPARAPATLAYARLRAHWSCTRLECSLTQLSLGSRGTLKATAAGSRHR